MMPPTTPPATAADDVVFLRAPLLPVLMDEEVGVLMAKLLAVPAIDDGVDVPVIKDEMSVDEDGMGVLASIVLGDTDGVASGEAGASAGVV